METPLEIVVVDDDDNLAGVISQKDILRHGTMLFQPATPFALIVLDLITGIPIFSYQFPDAPDEIFEDIDLFGGTLKIMTSLIEEVLRTGGGLREIQKGNFTLIIEPGLKTVCVLVANRSSIGKRKRLQRFRDQFETDYHDFLVAFSGSHPPPVTKFRTADKLVHYHFHDIDEGTTPDIAARKTTE